MAIRTTFNTKVRNKVRDAITEEYEENSKDSDNHQSSYIKGSAIIIDSTSKHMNRGYSNKSLPYFISFHFFSVNQNFRNILCDKRSSFNCVSQENMVSLNKIDSCDSKATDLRSSGTVSRSELRSSNTLISVSIQSKKIIVRTPRSEEDLAAAKMQSFVRMICELKKFQEKEADRVDARNVIIYEIDEEVEFIFDQLMLSSKKEYNKVIKQCYKELRDLANKLKTLPFGDENAPKILKLLFTMWLNSDQFVMNYNEWHCLMDFLYDNLNINTIVQNQLLQIDHERSKQLSLDDFYMWYDSYFQPTKKSTYTKMMEKMTGIDSYYQNGGEEYPFVNYFKFKLHTLFKKERLERYDQCNPPLFLCKRCGYNFFDPRKVLKHIKLRHYQHK